MRWQEVISQQGYSDLSPEQKFELRDKFFEKHVMPQLKRGDDPEEFKSKFYDYTAELDTAFQQKSKVKEFISDVAQDTLKNIPYLQAIKGAWKIGNMPSDKATKEYRQKMEWVNSASTPQEREARMKSLDTSESRTMEPFTSPIDIAGAAAMGTIGGLGKGAAQIGKSIAREIGSELTAGGLDAAELAGKGVKALKGKALKKHLEESQNFIDNLYSHMKMSSPFQQVQPTKPSRTSLLDVIDDTDPDVKLVKNQFIQDEKQIKDLKRVKIKDVAAKTGRYVVDDTWNIRGTLEKESRELTKQLKKGLIPEDKIKDVVELQKALDNSVMKRATIRGSSAKVADLVDNVDKKIFSDMTKNEIKDLGRIRESLRTIETGKRGIMRPGDLLPEQHVKTLNAMQKSDPQRFQMLMKKAEQLQDIYKAELKKSLDAGTITRASYDNMMDKGAYYNPSRYIQHIDPQFDKVSKGGKVSVSTSGFKNLDEGSIEALEKDPRALLQEYVARNQSVIDRNNANKALYDLAGFDNSIVKRFDGDKVPSGYDTINVLIEGEKKQMIMPKELAAEWKGLDPILSKGYAKALSIVSGSKLLKTFATGINPSFALRNFARDAAFIYMSPEYKSFLPVAVGQMANNYRRTFKDALLKRGAYIDYINQGGGMRTLSQQGRLFEKHLTKAQDVLGALGDFSERWTRLAHRDRALLNGKSGEMATFIARDALDFNAGGTVAKAADSMVPYLNAGIQGTRGMFKFARKDPKKFALKLGNLAAVSAGLYYYNTMNYKGDYDKIEARDKATNWIVMTPLTYTDRNGETQRYHLSIPKDQSQRIFTSFFDNAISKVMHNETNAKQIELASRDFFSMLPGGESYLPPTMKASIGYLTNYDFWKDDNIWKREDDIKPEAQYTEYTPEVYKKAGKVFGMSPEKTRYAVQQIFTSNNTFTNYLGMGLDQMMRTLSPEEQKMTSEDIIRAIPGSRTFLRGVYEDSKSLERNKEIKMEINTESVMLKREQNNIFKTLEKRDSENNRKTMKQWIKKQDPVRQEYLSNRYQQFMEVKDIDRKNWKWWMDIAYETSPKSQAMMFYDKYKNLTRKEQGDMIKKLGRLDATKSFSFGNNFWIELQRLKAGE